MTRPVLTRYRQRMKPEQEARVQVRREVFYNYVQAQNLCGLSEDGVRFEYWENLELAAVRKRNRYYFITDEESRKG